MPSKTSNLFMATTQLFHFCVSREYQEFPHICLSTSSWSNLRAVDLWYVGHSPAPIHPFSLSLTFRFSFNLSSNAG